MKINQTAELNKHAPTISCLLLLVSGCGLLNPGRPLLYRPSCDLNPVLMVSLPEHIDTLAGCPKDRMIVESGINKDDGSHRTDDVKELFYLTRGDVEYEFVLFFSDSAAAHRYQSEKHYPFASEHYPVFREIKAEGRSACLRYTEQPRADPEGGSAPMGYYVSRASFCLRNAFIRVSTRDHTLGSDNLTMAVNDLAQMLNAALANTERK